MTTPPSAHPNGPSATYSTAEDAPTHAFSPRLFQRVAQAFRVLEAEHRRRELAYSDQPRTLQQQLAEITDTQATLFDLLRAAGGSDVHVARIIHAGRAHRAPPPPQKPTQTQLL